MLDAEIWPLAACLALFTLTQVVYSFPVPSPTPSYSSSTSLFYLLPPQWFTSQTSIYPLLTNCVNMLHHSLRCLRLTFSPLPHLEHQHRHHTASTCSSFRFLAAELWNVVSKWAMAPATGGCRCGWGAGTLDACAGCVCVAESCLCLIVLHCCLRRTGKWQLGWFMTGCGQMCKYVCVCVCARACV